MAKPLLQAMLRWLVVTPVMDVVSELGVLVAAQVTADGGESKAAEINRRSIQRPQQTRWIKEERLSNVLHQEHTLARRCRGGGAGAPRAHAGRRGTAGVGDGRGSRDAVDGKAVAAGDGALVGCDSGDGRGARVGGGCGWAVDGCSVRDMMVSMGSPATSNQQSSVAAANQTDGIQRT
jgi:hypothetical protein